MNPQTTILKEDIQEKLAKFKRKSCYSEIASLLTYSLSNVPSQLNHQLFGYIPSLFPVIEIKDSLSDINSEKILINEPVIFKVSFPKNCTMRGIPFFYLFCYLKENSTDLNVYFQSAANASKPLSQKQYTIAKEKISFEGLISAFKEPESTICISDPGHFVPGLNSSFYVGSKKINFPNIISNVVENICNAAQIKLNNTFLVGSSAGGMGALLSSTYFSSKVQVLSVNSQIITYGLNTVMNLLLETSDRDVLLKKFGNRVSCLNRFQQNINSVPNIYLLANINDNLHRRNYKFYQLYQTLFAKKGQANQSIFDSYYGMEGHGRPDKVSLKKKIVIAKESLMMRSNFTHHQLSARSPLDVSHAKNQPLRLNGQVKQDYNQSIKSVADLDFVDLKQSSFNKPINAERQNSFDAYISLGDNCEAGLQFVRIGYQESSFFRFTSAKFNSIFNIIKNDFSDIFNQEYIIPRPGCTRMVLNNKYKIAFHSKLSSTVDSQGNQYFSPTYDFEAEFQDETNKINYLIDKWDKLMKSDRKILFFLKNDSDKRYIDEKMANKLRKLLLSKYKNHNFQILCLQLDKFAESQWKNPYLINRYFPYFAPRTSAMRGNSPESSWNKIFREFPLSPKNETSNQVRAEYQAKIETADSLLQQDIQKSQFSAERSLYPTKGEISADQVAIAGKQSWLYINSGSNNLMEYHTGKKQISELEVNQWQQLLQQRIEWHQAHQIKYQHLFVPNKIAVYPEYYPHTINIEGDRPILQLQQACGQSFLYPNDLFLKQKSQYRLYNKHDCHWNFWGCYFAYSSVCQSLGIEPNNRLFHSSIEIVQQEGDLGAKYGVEERALQVNLKLNSQITDDNQLIYHCHQGSIRVLKNKQIALGKMIIFGDSFSNPGFPNHVTKERIIARLSTLFAETLNEVHFVWTPWIDYDYIEREKPDFVLTEMVERFLVRVPDDLDHLPLEEFAAQKLSKFEQL